LQHPDTPGRTLILYAYTGGEQFIYEVDSLTRRTRRVLEGRYQEGAHYLACVEVTLWAETPEVREDALRALKDAAGWVEKKT